jgi:DNA invertase Pin-like site-specific DNA recombinase
VKLLGYIRRSQDSGTGVSEEIQRAKIEQWAALYDHEIQWLRPDLDESSWTLERPGLQEALKLLADGQAEGIVAAGQDRLTRRVVDFYRLLDLAKAQGWHVFAVDTNLDTTKDSTLHAILAVFAQREYEEKRDRFDSARQNAVLGHGVHGGDKAPLGYSWTTRGHDKKGNPQRGPLTPNADAARIVAAFEARAEGQSWSEVVRLLGVKSQGHATAIISNRVYLGEARSGDYVKEGAHPALVSEELFRRVERRLATGARAQATIGHDQALLARVLRCGSCLYSLVLDRSVGSYRCKNIGCTSRASVQAQRIEPVVVGIALGWHEAQSPEYLRTRELEDAMLPGLEDALAEAEAERGEVEAQHERGELKPSAYGLALQAAQDAVEQARRALEGAEAGQGWLSLTPERVAEKLAEADVETLRSFIREQVRVLVYPVGRGNRVPVEKRISVFYLTAGKGTDPAETVEPPVPVPGVKTSSGPSRRAPRSCLPN